VIDAARDPVEWRKLARWALVGGLCLAGGVAILALLSGSFDTEDWKVVATSLGFSVFASTAAAGGSLRLREPAWARALGAGTVASSVAAYVLLVAALWIEDADAVARGFGIAGLAALWTSHASLVLGARRPADSGSVRALSVTAVAALGIDTAVGMLALAGLLESPDAEPLARVLAALLVVAVLSTALVPVLRRTAPRAAAAPAPAWPGTRDRLAVEVAETADRLSAMELPPQARAEVARLRELARRAGA
jgi:hypothetical protein